MTHSLDRVTNNVFIPGSPRKNDKKGIGKKKGEKQLSYPNDEVVAFETTPFVVDRNPLWIGKDLIINCTVDFIQVLVKVPTETSTKNIIY